MKNTIIRVMLVLIFTLLILFVCGLNVEATVREWDISKDSSSSVKATLNYDNKTLEISGYGDMQDWSIGNYPPWYGNTEDIEKVIIGNELKNIGKNAFLECTNLTLVSVKSDKIRYIDNSVFSGCDNLETIECNPNSYVERYAQDKGIGYVNGQIGKWDISKGTGKVKAELDYFSKTLSITGTGTMKDWEESSLALFQNFSDHIEKLNLGLEITNIGKNAFYGLKKLTNVNIHENIVSIGEDAFRNSGVRRAYIRNNNVNISNDIFDGTSDGLIIFGNNGSNAAAFANRFNYSFSILDSQTGYKMTFDIGVEENTLKAVLDYASRTLTISPMVNRNQPIEMQGYNILSNYRPAPWNAETAPNTWWDSQQQSQMYSDFIETVVVERNVKNIGENAFSECSKLKSVKISSNPIEIKDGAFSSCNEFRSIVCDGGFVSEISDNAFNGGSDENLVFDFGLVFPDPGCNIRASLDYKNEKLIVKPKGLEPVKMNDGLPSIVRNGSFYLSAFKDRIKTIEVLGGVTEIGSDAFKDFSNATKVCLGQDVKKIGNNAFANCVNLNRLEIPKNLTDITTAFYHCDSISTIKIGNGVAQCEINRDYSGFILIWNIGEDSQHREDIQATINYPFSDHKLEIKGTGRMRSWGQGTDAFFSQWGYLGMDLEITAVEIQGGIENIGNEAFRDNTHLTNISLPQSVSNIGSSAFEGCTGLTSVSLGYVSDIGTSAFKDCSSLGSVALHGFTSCSLGDYAFDNCNKLKLVVSRESMKVSENTFRNCNEELFLTWYEWQQPNIPYYHLSYEFKNATLTLTYDEGTVGARDYDSNIRASWNKDDFRVNIENVVIGQGITRIGNESFKEMSNIKNVTIPDTVTSIGQSAFNGCENIKEITIPNQVKSIEDSAFRGCSLDDLIIPNSETILGKYAFAENPLEIVEFKGIDCNINEGVFENCDSLKTVKMHKGANKIKYNAFGSNNNNDFTIEWKDGEIDVKFYNNIKALMVTAPDTDKNYTMTDRYTAHGDKDYSWKKQYFGIDTSPIKYIGIGKGIENVSLRAFSDLNNVQTVELSDTVSTISSNAFTNCSSLQGTIVIPESVNSIGNEVFSGCSGLGTVEIYNPEATFKKDVFKNCSTGTEGTLLIRGWEDSTSHDYARDNNIRFEPFDWKYCRVEFYYNGEIDDSLTWKYQRIDLNESINENSEIIQKAKQRGKKDGFKYDKFVPSLGEMSKNNVIKLYYKTGTETPDPSEIEYTINFYTKDDKIIQNISGGTLISSSSNILNSDEFIEYKRTKLKGTNYISYDDKLDDMNHVIKVWCREKTPEDEIPKEYTVKVYLDKWKDLPDEVIPNIDILDKVIEKPSEVDFSDSLKTVLEKVEAKYKEYRISEKPRDDKTAEIKVLLLKPNTGEEEILGWKKYTVNFYHSDTGNKIVDISGSTVEGYARTVLNSPQYKALIKEKVGEKYTAIKHQVDPYEKIITVWCRNRNPVSDLTSYTVKVFLNNWDNQVKSIANKVKETPDNVGTSQSLQRVIDNDILAVYTNYAISEMEQDDENAEIRVLLARESTTYTIKYYYDYDEKTKETETCSGVVGDIITKDTIKEKIKEHQKAGYTLVQEPKSILLVMDSRANIMRVYYVKGIQPELTGFRIEYYYDYTDKEEEMYPGKIGQTITKDTIQQQINAHKKEGYILIKDPVAITLGKDPDANIIRVYYVKPEDSKLTGFRIEYYYDYQIDNNATEILPGTIGHTITKDSVEELIRAHKRKGYMLSTKDNPNPDPLAIKLEADPDANIMRVYYVKESGTKPGEPENPKLTGYKIQYYYDGKFNNSATGVFSGEEGNTITKEMIQIHIDAHRNGYKFSKTENLPLTLKANIADNVIKVYYIKDGSTNPDPGGQDPTPNPGGTNPGSNNQGGGSNNNGNGSNVGGTSSSTGTSSKGNGKTITGSPSDSLASKIIPKTGLEVGLLVGIIALSGVAVVCYKKSKWN